MVRGRAEMPSWVSLRVAKCHREANPGLPDGRQWWRAETPSAEVTPSRREGITAGVSQTFQRRLRGAGGARPGMAGVTGPVRGVLGRVAEVTATGRGSGGAR
ncbi:hypothetical protein Ssi03_75920 [Sphaerisporangium siamense]|nr:hypothetical protein Ssi03_75920 [Sphaerisporangium siamense]